MTPHGAFGLLPALSVSGEFFVMYQRLYLRLALVATGAGLILGLLLTRRIIDWLRNRGYVKAIRTDGPDHAAKAGTPTMGGLAILAAAGLTVLLLVLIDRLRSSPPPQVAERWSEILLVLIATAAFAMLGLWDDLEGLARRSGQRELGVGLTARRMFGLQALVALALSTTFLVLEAGALAQASIPVGVQFLAVPVLSLVILGSVNGVNFSDGLDGLAAGLLAIAFGAMAVIHTAFWLIPVQISSDSGGYLVVREPWDRPWVNAEGGIILPLIFAGACLGFLVFNRRPARVFMGNVGSMGLGAALAMLAVVNHSWWLLPVFGAVFMAEVLSVIIQVSYFKWTRGKRFFRMAPIHHHFELKGLTETQIVRRFWLTGLVSGAIGVAIGFRALQPLANLAKQLGLAAPLFQ